MARDDRDEIAELARQAGLSDTFARHPEDVISAAASAAALAGRLDAHTLAAFEPWPPIRLEPRRG